MDQPDALSERALPQQTLLPRSDSSRFMPKALFRSPTWRVLASKTLKAEEAELFSFVICKIVTLDALSAVGLRSETHKGKREPLGAGTQFLVGISPAAPRSKRIYCLAATSFLPTSFSADVDFAPCDLPPLCGVPTGSMVVQRTGMRANSRSM